MTAYRYQAVESNGTPVKGVIEADDRKAALQLLGGRGLFPSVLEASTAASVNSPGPAPLRFGGGIIRKEITAFTRELGALLGAAIPIPQALDGLGEEEENPGRQFINL